MSEAARAESSIIVSVIIPALNEEAFIERCLSSIRRNDIPSSQVEVILVDGQSDDETIARARAAMDGFSDFRILDNPQRTAPAAMNLGIAAARGTYIARADAHAEYPKDYLSTLLAAAERHKATVGNVGSVIRTEPPVDSPEAIAIAEATSMRIGVGGSRFRTGTAVERFVDTVPFGFFPRSVLEEVGGYDERLKRSQDIELNRRIARAGWKILLLPEPAITYYSRATLGAMMRKYVENAKWNVWVAVITRRYRSLGIRSYVPTVALLAWCVAIVLGLVVRPLFMVGMVGLGLYGILITVGALIVPSGRAGRLRLVWTLLLLHLSHGVGGAKGLVLIRDALRRRELGSTAK